MKPTLIVISGPNGAGKTTFARQLITVHLPNHFEFLNADLIADALSPFRPQSVAIAAGKEFLRRFDQLISKKRSFLIETTLSSLTIRIRLEKARSAGYRIEMIYLALPDPELAIQRVIQRVKLGGHDIPHNTIRRRFGRSLKNFRHIYLNLTDTAIVMDGARSRPRRIATWKSGAITQVLDYEYLTQIHGWSMKAEEQPTDYMADERSAFVDWVDQAAVDVEQFLSQLEEASGVPLVVSSSG